MPFLSVYHTSWILLEIFPFISITLFFRKAIVAALSTEQNYETLSKNGLYFTTQWIRTNG